MILGRHWRVFCEALSYLHGMFNNANFYLEFHATRLSRISDGTDYRRLFDESFMRKTQKPLLERLGTCLRGVEGLHGVMVDGEELAESIADKVTGSPWDDGPAWLGYLEDSITPAKQAAEEGKLLEASGAFEHILERLELIPDQGSYAENIEFYSKYNAIIDSCTLGLVQCCLLQSQSPPPGACDLWYTGLDTIITRELTSSTQAQHPKLRALHHLYGAQLLILSLYSSLTPSLGLYILHAKSVWCFCRLSKRTRRTGRS